ncbi:hypothetical protein HK102_002615, partial [Quaeritorhiza haematococci]
MAPTEPFPPPPLIPPPSSPSPSQPPTSLSTASTVIQSLHLLYALIQFTCVLTATFTFHRSKQSPSDCRRTRHPSNPSSTLLFIAATTQLCIHSLLTALTPSLLLWSESLPPPSQNTDDDMGDETQLLATWDLVTTTAAATTPYLLSRLHSWNYLLACFTNPAALVFGYDLTHRIHGGPRRRLLHRDGLGRIAAALAMAVLVTYNVVDYFWLTNVPESMVLRFVGFNVPVFQIGGGRNGDGGGVDGAFGFPALAFSQVFASFFLILVGVCLWSRTRYPWFAFAQLVVLFGLGMSIFQYLWSSIVIRFQSPFLFFCFYFPFPLFYISQFFSRFRFKGTTSLSETYYLSTNALYKSLWSISILLASFHVSRNEEPLGLDKTCPCLSTTTPHQPPPNSTNNNNSTSGGPSASDAHQPHPHHPHHYHGHGTGGHVWHDPINAAWYYYEYYTTPSTTTSLLPHPQNPTGPRANSGNGTIPYTYRTYGSLSSTPALTAFNNNNKNKGCGTSLILPDIDEDEEDGGEGTGEGEWRVNEYEWGAYTEVEGGKPVPVIWFPPSPQPPTINNDTNNTTTTTDPASTKPNPTVPSSAAATPLSSASDSSSSSNSNSNSKGNSLSSSVMSSPTCCPAAKISDDVIVYLSDFPPLPPPFQYTSAVGASPSPRVEREKKKKNKKKEREAKKRKGVNEVDPETEGERGEEEGEKAGFLAFHARYGEQYLSTMGRGLNIPEHGDYEDVDEDVDERVGGGVRGRKTVKRGKVKGRVKTKARRGVKGVFAGVDGGGGRMDSEAEVDGVSEQGVEREESDTHTHTHTQTQGLGLVLPEPSVPTATSPHTPQSSTPHTSAQLSTTSDPPTPSSPLLTSLSAAPTKKKPSLASITSTDSGYTSTSTLTPTLTTSTPPHTTSTLTHALTRSSDPDLESG